MYRYYTAVAALSCLSLCVLSILVYENGHIDRKKKRCFYETYILIILSIIAEWAGVALNGAPGWTKGIHVAVKTMDYIFTPIAGVFFARQVLKQDRWQKYMLWLLGANTVFQSVSAFTGWMVYVDEENYYYHGPLYFVYVLVFCLAILYALYGFLVYGKRFKKKNSSSLYAIIMIVCVGIGMQEVIGGEIRTASFSLALGSLLLFIHFSEFQQQKKDDDMSQQRILIETDVLTGMLSRYAYSETLNEYQQKKPLPEDLVVFVIDINGLKNINDTMGHEAGDNLICGAAECIQKAMGSYGRCFRTGGDEFVAILRMEKEQISGIQKNLKAETARWRGEKVGQLSVSSGYAIAREHPELSIEKLVNVADQMMYAAKAKFYNNPKEDRRKRYE